MRLPQFEHLEPHSLDEALSLLAEHREEVRIIAGGTELLVSMKQRLLSPGYLLNLKELPELKFISYDNAGLRIGALTTLADLTRSKDIRRHFPILTQAAEQVAAPPLQQMGTLGGNLCLNTRCFYYNQSRLWRQVRPPCYKTGGDLCHAVRGDHCYAVYQGDMAPALMALGARLTIARKGEQRIADVGDLYTGNGERPIALAADELLVEIQLPPSSAAQGGDYQKLHYRGAMDFPLAGVAAVLRRDGSDISSEAKVALTAVGTRPILVQEANEFLQEQTLTDELIEQVAEAAYEAARPVANIGSSPSYRRKMVRLLTNRALHNAWQRK
jgi:4-hydroxybenzoyl-CoA reductase subunit beta